MQTDKYGRIWFHTEGNETKIGFTPEFIEKLQECFHIVPGKRVTQVRENGPLMAIETNTGLFSVTSPVKGYVTFFDNKALNFPEKITPEDTVCIISEKEKESKKTGRTLTSMFNVAGAVHGFLQEAERDEVHQDVPVPAQIHREVRGQQVNGIQHWDFVVPEGEQPIVNQFGRQVTASF